MERAWLNTIPFSHRLSPTDQAGDDLLAIHANPLDVNQVIFPPEEEQIARYGRIRQTDEELSNLLADTEAAVLAFGHLHIPGERVLGKLHLINISSVSMPGDGDPRAKYGLCTWDGKRWYYEQRCVAYDIRPELDAYRQNQPPSWQNIVETMESEGCFPQKV